VVFGWCSEGENLQNTTEAKAFSPLIDGLIYGVAQVQLTTAPTKKLETQTSRSNIALSEPNLLWCTRRQTRLSRWKKVANCEEKSKTKN